MSYQRSLLIDESPLQVIPALAKAIGLNEAIMLQQIHYWQRISPNEKNGVRYAAKSAGEMVETFSFWSEKTIKRTVATLRDRGLLVTTKKADNSWDRANWYAVDYATLNQLNVSLSASGQNDPMHRDKLTPSTGSKRPDGSGQVDPMIKEVKNLNTREGLAKGAKAPSAVSTCFQAYQTGIKALYGADYPTSAKANGQLANLVARVGAEQAVAVVKYYLARTDPWLVKRKHGLEFLCKEAERWCLDMQQATGGSQEGPVTIARTALVYEDDKAVELKEYPAGEPEQIARRVLVDWRTKISNTKPKYISVLQGKKATRFSLAELQEKRA